MAHILRKSNFQKTYHYLKRNGLKNAYYAVLERVKSSKGSDYHYEEAEEEVLAKQKQEAVSSPYRFSILVPAYETKEEYLREMIESVLGQSYGKFELIIADASQSDAVQKTVNGYLDRRIRYLRLEENKGISENTNAALAVAKGEYIGLLDHDDVLTPDALYEMSKAIRESVQRGKTAWLLYSDEDKGNGDMTEFYEPHRKHGLNMDLLFSNNYICHFLVMRRELMRSLRFRPDYDGAQDYDLILRAIGRLIYEEERGRDSVIHIPKVLYHWRCHAESTAENPESKQYAYEAGRRALEDFMAARGWRGKAEHTLHLGFYRIAYENSIFAQRKEVGVIGGKLVDKKGCIAGGIYNSRGRCLYAGLNRNFSGYMHRAGLDQEAYAVDLRCMRVKKELWGIFEDVFGISYREKEMGANRRFPYEEIMFSAGKESSARGSGEIKRNETNAQEGGTDIIKGETGTKKGDTDGVTNADDNLKKLCIEFGRRVRRAGYTVVWLPDWEWKIYGKTANVTVVIPNYNGIKYIDNCLKSLIDGETVPEIIVVDNGSRDGSAEIVEKKYPMCRLVRFKENRGFCHAVNEGIRLAVTEYIILLNNDTIVDAKMVSRLVKSIRNKRKAFSVAAKMISMQNPEIIDDAGDLYCALGWAFALGKGKESHNYSSPTEIFAACGGAAIYRKNLFSVIGDFDENHFAYLEDIDIGYRAKISGFANYYEPGAIVYHAGSAVSGSRYNEFKVKLSSKNSIYLIYKNMPILQILLNLPFLTAGIIIKSFFFARKGMGKTYWKGIWEGIRLCCSKEGKKNKVPFRPECLGNYVRIQLELWGNMIRRLTG